MAGSLALQPTSELAGFSGSRSLFQPRLPSPDLLNDGYHAAHISEHPGLLYVLTRQRTASTVQCYIAGLAFIAYWGIVLFGYDTYVFIFPTLTGHLFIAIL